MPGRLPHIAGLDYYGGCQSRSSRHVRDTSDFWSLVSLAAERGLTRFRTPSCVAGAPAAGHTRGWPVYCSGLGPPNPGIHRIRHHPTDFIQIEGCRQDVVSAQIQHLGPEFLVGEPGCDDDSRRVRQFPDFVEQELPVSIRLVPLANHDSHGLRHGLPQALRQCFRMYQSQRQGSKHS